MEMTKITKPDICWNEDIPRQEAYKRWKAGEDTITCCDACARELRTYLIKTNTEAWCKRESFRPASD